MSTEEPVVTFIESSYRFRQKDEEVTDKYFLEVIADTADAGERARHKGRHTAFILALQRNAKEYVSNFKGMDLERLAHKRPSEDVRANPL